MRFEVAGYVEAELDRRHPVRVLMRSEEPADLREVWSVLTTGWASTLVRPVGHEQSAQPGVEGEWSAVQTLRHLLCVHDGWFARAVLGRRDAHHGSCVRELDRLAAGGQVSSSR